SPYADKVLTGAASAGYNEVLWDGTDGNGVRVLSGTTISDAETQMYGAEVHFPFIDMEVNPKGFVIEYLDANFEPYPNSVNGSEYTDLVYWDDRNISSNTDPSNPKYNGNEALPGYPGSGSGIRSNPNGSAGSAANGHKF